MQFFQVQTGQVAHFNVFEVLPESFVRIEIRGVGWQTFQKDFVRFVLGQELSYIGTAMDRRPIPDHQQPAGRRAQEVLQKANAIRAGQRGLAHQGVQFTPGVMPLRVER